MFQLLRRCVTPASRSVSASLPEPSSVLAWRVPVASAVVGALLAALPMAEPYAEVAHARSEVELAASELVHSLWALAGCSVELREYELAPAESWAVGSAPPCWARAYSARADLIALAELLSAPAD